MALTVTVVSRNVVGAQRCVVADVTFDSSYPTGGESFAPSDADPTASASATFTYLNVGMNDATIADNRLVSYDYTNEKLVLRTAGATESAGASDQSGVTIRVQGFYDQVTG